MELMMGKCRANFLPFSFFACLFVLYCLSLCLLNVECFPRHVKAVPLFDRPERHLVILLSEMPAGADATCLGRNARL